MASRLGSGGVAAATSPTVDTGRPIVVDTSFIAAVQLVAGDEHVQAMAILGVHHELWAPDHLRAELLLLVARWRRERSADYEQALQVLRDTEALISNFVPTSHLVEDALRITVDHGLATNTGLFVALAERQKTLLITFDEELVESYPERCKHPADILE